MNTRVLLAAAALAGSLHAADPQWEVHDMKRPQPPANETASINAEPPPAGAIVLFDGTNLDAWTQIDGAEPRWLVKDGALEVAPTSGDLRTKQAFGSCKLHIEWRSPLVRTGSGQESGNSGVFLMSYYEVQVLDSYRNPTYADGMAGAIYGQNPPSENPSRPTGEWNSYDITFHRPEFDEKGNVTKPARVTLVFNGVKVQDDFALTGRTVHKQRAHYEPHPDKMPLVLQDHGNPVQFRNIWLVPLDD